MGRPKNFSRKGVLEKALPVFWRRGFADASLHELEQATGVNKSGLYSEFEDKEDLLALSTIDRGRAGELPSIRVDQPVVQTVGAELVHTPLKIINGTCRHEQGSQRGWVVLFVCRRYHRSTAVCGQL